MLNKLLKISLPIFLFALFFIFAPKAFAAGCAGTGSCYWVGGTGNFNDTAKWATASGGATTGSVPTSADDCIFDSLSTTPVTNYTATVNAISNCKDITFSDTASGAPTFAGNSTLF